MKRFTKNGRAQNLFTASILFIVLMVMVSITVNLLIETHARQPPLTEELKITSVNFSQGNIADVFVNNSGTLDAEIAEVWINNEKQAFTVNPPIETLMPNASVHVLVTCPYSNGTNYNIKIVSNRGNVYLASASVL
jgi:hypothetical protein